MPAYTRNQKRESLVFVPVNLYMSYGFKTKDLSSLAGVSSADITALGHVSLDAAIGCKIVGAKTPKPPRVSKKIPNATPLQQQSVSTFCGYDKLVAALAAGWNMSKRGQSVIIKPSSATRGTLTAIALLSDFSLYCFSMNKADFEAYGAELGLKSATQITGSVERKKLVSGSSTPYPGRASKELADGSRFTSFYSTEEVENISTLGYDILSEEKTLPIGIPF
ncbi:hypothetical protein H6G36_29205 [Anabaena minutissima FACHB-250]|nr:hypothetical protein [Anabaena minutissima FACHB-250]